MVEVEKNKKRVLKLVITVIIIVVIAYLIRKSGVMEFMADFKKMRDFIEGFGIWGPLVYTLIYIVSCLFLFPGSVRTILTGFLFGAVKGGFIALIGAVIGATLAFLIARHAGRKLIEEWAGNNPLFQKIDKGVEENGSSFLILTRLVPIFPFNVQNYAYGLTKISLSTYVFWSAICMAPGAFIYTYFAGEVYTDGISKELLIQFAVVGLILFGISLLIKRIAKKKGIKLKV